MLSFAVGGLLGDVFLHLFPEAYSAARTIDRDINESRLNLGLWILGKHIFSFKQELLFKLFRLFVLPFGQPALFFIQACPAIF